MRGRFFTRGHALEIGIIVVPIVVGGVALVESLLSPAALTRNDGGLGPNWFPIVMSLTLIGLALIVAVQLIREAAREAEPDGAGGTEDPLPERIEASAADSLPSTEVPRSTGPATLSASEWKRLGRFIAIMAAYILLMPRLGFLISTTAFIIAMYLHLGVRQWVVPILVAVGASFGVYGVFALLLDVQLPVGAIFGR